MNLEQFIKYLEHPEKLDAESLAALKEVIDEYPYFQTAQLLYAKNLHNLDDVKYEKQLKVTATYATDRSVLFDLINKEKAKEEVTELQRDKDTEEEKGIRHKASEEVEEVTKTQSDKVTKEEVEEKEPTAKSEERKEEEEVTKAQSDKDTEEEKGIRHKASEEVEEVTKTQSDKVTKEEVEEKEPKAKSEERKAEKEPIAEEEKSKKDLADIVLSRIKDIKKKRGKGKSVEEEKPILEEKKSDVGSQKLEEGKEELVVNDGIQEEGRKTKSEERRADEEVAKAQSDKDKEKAKGIRQEASEEVKEGKGKREKGKEEVTELQSDKVTEEEKKEVAEGSSSKEEKVEKKEPTAKSEKRKAEEELLDYEKIDTTKTAPAYFDILDSLKDSKSDVGSQKLDERVQEEERKAEEEVTKSQSDKDTKKVKGESEKEKEDKNVILDRLKSIKDIIENVDAVKDEEIDEQLKSITESLSEKLQDISPEAAAALTRKKPEIDIESPFSEWLDKHGTDGDLISAFIENDPRLTPQDEPEQNIDASEESGEENEDFLTETLAKIYIQQGHYQKALKAYRKLSLNNLEKNVYFADQIEELKKLIQKPIS